jgi:hypothetical protein
VDVSSHDIESETCEVEVGMSVAVARIPYGQVLIIGMTSRAKMEDSGTTFCENCLLAY